MPTGQIVFPVSDQQGNTSTAVANITVTGGSDAVISGDQPSGFTVPAGQTWEIQGLVTTPANVIVRGTLRMRPGSTLRFRDVNEAAFVGGDTAVPVASDVGLWIVDQGRLDAQGTAKTPWTRAVGAIAIGAASFDVADAAGWQPGDEIVITATASRSTSSYWQRDDRRTITAVSGNTVTVNSGLSNAHPARTIPAATLPSGLVRPAVTYMAEVLNLTRDVRIEGTPAGRAHVVFLHQGHTAFAQVPASYVELRHLAPQKSGANVAGRYAWHYHHSHGTTEGLVNVGLVAHDCGGHCFVTHASNGVRWDRCVTHDTRETPYWWDPTEDSERVVYDRCVASRATCFTGPQRFETHGFFAAQTQVPLASKMLGCVATSIDSSSDPSGYFWNNASVGVWTFEDCLSHNIRHMGIRVWQNISDLHPIDRFHAYSCAEGITHGAYSNNYQYHDVRMLDCGIGFAVHAVSRFGPAGRFGSPGCRQEWHRATVAGCPTPLLVGDAAVDSEAPTHFLDCAGLAPVTVTPEGGGHVGHTNHRDFENCGLAPADFTWTSPVQAITRFRVQEATGPAWQITDTNPTWTQTTRF